jgi:hypothetical protein
MSIFKIQEQLFDFVSIITYILYFGIIFGFSLNAPHYLTSLNYYITIYVSIFLIFRFNPFRNVEFTSLDKKIVFTAGVFLFMTTVINTILINYLELIKAYFSKKI